jgi:hypothetical protein
VVFGCMLKEVEMCCHCTLKVFPEVVLVQSRDLVKSAKCHYVFLCVDTWRSIGAGDINST